MKREILDIFSSTEKCLYRCFFDEEFLERIEKRDSLTYELQTVEQKAMLWPATQYLQDTSDLEQILAQMQAEKDLRVKEFESLNMSIEAERIKKRVEYDIRMIRETGLKIIHSILIKDSLDSHQIRFLTIFQMIFC